ncbi:MAG: hypothetical protein ABI233_05245 [Chthoniobacterales bacterium]
MSLRKRLLVLVLILAVASLVTALLAPFAVARGIGVWLWWAARHENVRVDFAKIDAPFLRPVTIERLRIAPAHENGRPVSLQAERVTLDLNFRGWLFTKRARFLHSIAVERLKGSVRQGAAHGGEKLDWRNLARLLPNEFRITEGDFDVVTAATSFVFRGVNLTASDIASGGFFARQVSVTSPILRQSFTGLRGATSWEDNRLTIAGVSLVRGLDLEALAVDLSNLRGRRIGLEFTVDAFGGVLRASFHGQGGGPKFVVDLAGSAANVSLAQVSAAAGFLEPLTGAVRASQFTFRGSPGEFLDATASVWIEVSDFAWRARRGDHLVFGATYYDRRLQVEQLYVQQRPNELTVNGELLWPKRRPSWTGLRFRGQLNATIPDADAFAQLFGAASGDFSGALSASGEIDSIDPSAHGKLDFRGNGMRFRGVSLDSLGGEIQLDGSEANLEKLEIRHGDDFLRARGTANLARPHAYSGRLTGAINDLATYAPLLPSAWRKKQIGGGITFDWTGDGTPAASSGTAQIFAHGLRLPIAALRSASDLTLEGTYSPQDVFFRNFRLANDRLSLGGFLMLGNNFVELQAMMLTLDGVPRANGTLFLPFGVDRWRKSGSLFEAFDEHQKFDVDLAVDHLDLADFAGAVGEPIGITGMLDGKLAVYGPLASLQVTTKLHLENPGPAVTANATDFDLRYQGGQVAANLRAVFGFSAPVIAHASLPVHLEKNRVRDLKFLERALPFSVSVSCPALFLTTLPDRLRPLGATSGIVSGEIAYSNTLRDPTIEGSAQLLDLDPKLPPLWPHLTNLSAEVEFQNHAAEIPQLRFDANDQTFHWSGRLTTRPPFFTLTLSPTAGATVDSSSPSETRSTPLKNAVVRGTIDSPDFSLTINERTNHQKTWHINPATQLIPAPLCLHLVRPASAEPTLELRVSDTQSRWP